MIVELVTWHWLRLAKNNRAERHPAECYLLATHVFAQKGEWETAGIVAQEKSITNSPREPCTGIMHTLP